MIFSVPGDSFDITYSNPLDSDPRDIFAVNTIKVSKDLSSEVSDGTIDNGFTLSIMKPGSGVQNLHLVAQSPEQREKWLSAFSKD